MTNEDKKIVADYMGWPEDEILVGYCTGPDRMAHFDANDASFCVAEMWKRGEWWEFHNFARNLYYTTNRSDLKIDYNFAAWLYTAENFFGAMAKWLKEGNK